jgi:regulator of nucleoside diphosphate kinase
MAKAQDHILITLNDYERLRRLIETHRRSQQRDAAHLDALEAELDRAIVTTESDIRADVVRMNSLVRIKDLKNGREFVYEIVLPRDADISSNRISVLAPIGTALLGYAIGASVEWQVPSGTRRLRIMDVEHQSAAQLMAA